MTFSEVYEKFTLHSTMFLLILPDILKFYSNKNTLHSTMFLLIPFLKRMSKHMQKALHSTMFLLIRCSIILQHFTRLFTFHNVSINTDNGTDNDSERTSFTFHNVSINTHLVAHKKEIFISLHSTMFLLIRAVELSFNRHYLHFTFHNVSINTVHSVSYLTRHSDLYIPQCFY